GGYGVVFDKVEKAWAKARLGNEASASILDSRVQVPRPQGELISLDLIGNSRHTIMDANCVQVRVSPDAQYAACLRQSDTPRVAVEGILREGSIWSLLGVSVSDTQGRTLRRPDGPKDVLVNSMHWSPDSSRLSLIGF